MVGGFVEMKTWEMTLEQYIEEKRKTPHVHSEMMVRNAVQVHRAHVKAALANGEQVGEEVLRDYPEFIKGKGK